MNALINIGTQVPNDELIIHNFQLFKTQNTKPFHSCYLVTGLIYLSIAM
jgi:hypothetical protein